MEIFLSPSCSQTLSTLSLDSKGSACNEWKSVYEFHLESTLMSTLDYFISHEHLNYS